MKVARLRVRRFRGFEHADLLLGDHIVVIGQPRAGRSDLAAALRRVLDPASTSGRVDPLDVHRPLAAPGEDGSPPLTEVEVTLADLGAGLEQDFFNQTEAFDPKTFEVADATTTDPVLGLRLCYRLEYDEATGVGRHWVDFSTLSDPATGRSLRPTRSQRALLPFVVVDRLIPLQLRAEGRLRGLLEANDAVATETEIGSLLDGVRAATDRLSASTVVREGVARVMGGGAASMLGLDGPSPEDAVSFVAEDGSTAALLRAVQPALDLDAAGDLPLRNHGSTAAGVLAAAEAAVAAADPGAVVVADDFGDDLDASAADYLTRVLKGSAGQVVVTTRRPEVARACRDEEIRRLSLHGGVRGQHRLPPTVDRKERAVRRQALRELLNAMSAQTVALLEGPGDLQGYESVAERRFVNNGKPPPAAFSVRLSAPTGGDGGKDRLLHTARLAQSLGFRVKVVIDGDKPGDSQDVALVTDLLKVAETVVRLPDRTAVEGALVDGLPDDTVLEGLNALDADFGLGLATAGKTPEQLRRLAKDTLKGKGGLHREWVERIRRRPRLACQVLDALTTGPAGLNQLIAPAQP